MIKNLLKNYMKYFKLTLLIVLFILLPKVSSAAILYFDPDEGQFGLGDEFSINIKMDISESCINTIEASIDFSSDIANLVDFSTGESFLDIWVEKPSTSDMDEINQSGILYFAGGIPGGYCGKIPGDPGESNIVGTMHFKIPTFSVSTKDKNIINLEFLPKTRALINDGLGTEDALVKNDAKYTFTDDASFPNTDWQDRLKEDTVPPEPFVIELQQNSGLFDNQYYIIFNTKDKQTGIDHYEVLEIKPGEIENVAPRQSVLDTLLSRKLESPHWVEASTPFLLKDQSLKSIIRVKAVDKASNVRTVEFVPNIKIPSAKTYSIGPLIVLLLIVVVVFSLIIILIYKYVKGREKNEQNKDS